MSYTVLASAALRTSIRLAAALFVVVAASFPLAAAEPLKVGFSAQLTGGLAANGKALLLAAQIWAEDVNARGGLLGRPVQLVYYDDQSTPSQIPAIYSKLIDVDKVDLLIGYATNLVAAAMPTVIARKRTIMAMFALALNEQFKYPRYFQIQPYGPTGAEHLAEGYFKAALSMTPRPATIALVGADAEFAKSAVDGARRLAQRAKLKIVYDRAYPPNTIDYSPIVRAVQSTNSDLVYVASYPPDTVGIIRSAHEIKLKPRVFGGAMVGTQYAAVKTQLGELLKGLVSFNHYVREPTVRFPGIDQFLYKYQARAAAQGVDQLGYYVPPFAYAALQVVEQAVIATNSVDDKRLADYIHASKFSTVVGDIRFGADGEWTEGRLLTVQFQRVKETDLKQFEQPGTEVILDPPSLKSGDLLYPYSDVSR